MNCNAWGRGHYTATPPTRRMHSENFASVISFNVVKNFMRSKSEPEFLQAALGFNRKNVARTKALHSVRVFVILNFSFFFSVE